MSYFSDIITTEDQYETAKARATIAFTVSTACMVATHLPEYFDGKERELGKVNPHT